jgi:PAS domain-containing protein
MMTAEPPKVEQIPRQTHDLFSLLTENVSDVIFILDLNLQHRYCSPFVERLRGYLVKEVMAQTLEQVLTPRFVSKGKKSD